MATTTFKYLIFILFLSFIIKGSSYCNLNNIIIGTTRSGREIGGMPEWNIVVTNNCCCTQSQIRLACKGFKTTMSVSPSILSIQGDSCLLINGNPLKGFATVRFSYAWDPPFLLLPTSSHTSCITKGSSYCNLNNIIIGTTRSGREICGMPEWNVVVTNNCCCTQNQIRLACKGFKTTMSVNPSILSIQNDSCLLINGNSLKSFATIRFSYAWDPPFLLLPTSSHISCS